MSNLSMTLNVLGENLEVLEKLWKDKQIKLINLEIPEFSFRFHINKNDNIHKNEVQDIRLSDEYCINLTTNHYYPLLWFKELFEVKYDIGFGITIEFPSQKKKLFKSAQRQRN